MTTTAPSIPRIVHQTWKSAEIPGKWAPYVQSWRSQHPDWEWRLWTDDDNRAFVHEFYPRLLPVFDSYPYAIQRADAVRYCLLHHFGGVYVDMDIECLRPLDDLLAGHEFLAVPEPDEQADLLERKFVLSNALMASVPGHAFLDAIIERLIASPDGGFTHRDVLLTTGPIMMTDVFAAYAGTDVAILDSTVAFPFLSTAPELDEMRTRMPRYEALKASAIGRGAYAVHYWANSWIGTLAGELYNPDPANVPGFDFYPGLDSPGSDIANVGRDILKAAAACADMKGAVAFNTDGFVKGRLRPRTEWRLTSVGELNEGLYVRKQSGGIREKLGRFLGRT